MKNGRPTDTLHAIRASIRLIRESYGHTPAVDFGPLALKALQARLIETGVSRGYINRHVETIRRMFRWAVSEEMIPPAVLQAIATVSGLRKGRTTARELPPVQPVDEATFQGTLPYLSQVVCDMVRFQWIMSTKSQQLAALKKLSQLYANAMLPIWAPEGDTVFYMPDLPVEHPEYANLT